MCKQSINGDLTKWIVQKTGGHYGAVVNDRWVVGSGTGL